MKKILLYKKKKNNMIGYLNQSGFLYDNLSIAINLKIFGQEIKLSYFEEMYENYKLPVNRDLKVKFLSLGQKKKLEITILFSSNYDFFFLDEPLNYLDKKGKSIFVESIDKNKKYLIIDHTNLIPEMKNINVAGTIKLKMILQNNNKKESPIKFYNQFRNLRTYSKLYLLVILVMYTISLLLINDIYPINNHTNKFINSYISEYEPENNEEYAMISCKKIDDPKQSASPYTEEVFMQKMPIFDRTIFTRYSYSYDEEFGITEYILEHPKEMLENFDGQMYYYNISDIVIGTIPENYSSDIMVDIFTAKNIAKKRKIPVNDLIGEELIISGSKYIISGIYSPIDSNEYSSNIGIIHSYEGNEDNNCYFINDQGIDKGRILNNIIFNYIISILVGIILFSGLYSLEQNFFKTIKAHLDKNYVVNTIIFIFIVELLIISFYMFNSPY